jgi:hypothetical protein
MANLQNKLPAPVADLSNPVLQFQFTYPHAFTTIAQAFVRKYSYEQRTHLTGTTGVTQLDADRFQFYRRVDSVFTEQLSWERVTVDRREGGSITSELLLAGEGGSDLLFE